MYAVKGLSYRSIASVADLLPGETAYEELPAQFIADVKADETAKALNEEQLRQAGSDALVDLRAYRDLASPTNAQTVAVVKLICRVLIGIIRITQRKFDATT